MHLFGLIFLPATVAITLSTPNYPAPYAGNIPRIRVSLDVYQGQGVAVVFEQFLVSPDDCAIACQTGTFNCSYICGDVMDHGLIPKILRVEGSATVTLQTTKTADGFPHSGVSAKLVAYDLSDPAFVNCGESINISNGSTFYLLSPNYPLTPPVALSTISTPILSTIHFKSQDLIKMGACNKGYETYDNPYALYFNKQVNITFSLSDLHVFYQKRFYIIVNEFLEVDEPSSASCIEPGNFVVKINERIQFGTKNFGVKAYEPNTLCDWNFQKEATNGESLLAFALSYESEKCCDIMEVDGLSQWHEEYQGWEYSEVRFTNSGNVTMRFSSDGVMQATGFQALVNHVDCSCGQDITLNRTVPIAMLTSPGYSQNAMTYCPNLTCSWKIYAEPDDNIFIELSDLALRSYTLTNKTDLLQITDAYGHIMATIPPNYLGLINFTRTVTPIYISFTSTSRKISVFFFSTIAHNVFVDVYDGDTSEANLIDNKPLYSNVDIDGYSFSLTSSQEHMLIRVQADIDLTISDHDFQAMVTDAKDENCGYLAYSISKQQSSEKIPFLGTNCFKVFHIMDLNYDLNKYLSLNLEERNSVDVYLGLSTNQENLLMSDTVNDLPRAIFSNYLTLKFSTKEEFYVQYSWFESGYILPFSMNSNETVVIMSRDYQRSSPPFEQQFSVELEGESSLQTGLRFEVLAPLGEGYGFIEMSNYDETLSHTKYASSNGTFIFQSCGTKMQIQYSSPGGSSSGLFAKASRADLKCKGTSSTSSSFLSFVISSVLLAFRK
ncbi:unnamed protein product [Caenorhabditis auriculariae]|uniref:CUB domain-containing protein n=1 Tax=Caenorhabditis auriculariae TaxID=2777116 RepID=A0A8S1H1F3_9PELO|nr:unnamed protein product [Caenorhabditis auriculariae]